MQHIQAVGTPILGTFSAARKHLKGEQQPRLSYIKPVMPRGLLSRSRLRGDAEENEEEDEDDEYIGVMPRGGADVESGRPWVVGPTVS